MAEPLIQLEPIETDWSAKAVDLGRIQDELDALWAAWRRARIEHGIEPEATGTDQVRMRPSTYNLTCIVDSAAAADRIAMNISAIGNFTPTRTIILNRAGTGKGAKSFQVGLAVQELQPNRQTPPVSIEVITISAPPGNDELLASLVAPLLAPDLPDILYLPDGPTRGNGLLRDLLEESDALVVDTSCAGNPGPDIGFLSRLTAADGPPWVSDLAWSRLGPARQLTAQFFDQESTLACLDTMSAVTITYGTSGTRDRVGFSAALLYAGWLSTRLGWRAPGELFQSGDGWRATLRAGEKGRSHEIVLRIEPSDDPVASCSLKSIELVSDEPHPGRFAVERISDQGVSTASEAGTMAKVSRVVYQRHIDDNALLGDALKATAEDPIYVQAVQFAATLFPEEMTT